jgi:hypothetical protein
MIRTQGDNMQIGFHTDAFNSRYWSSEQCLDWGQRNGIHFLECGTIVGVLHHSFVWRVWKEFGTSPLGDGAPHSCKMMFMALDLGPRGST